MTSELTTEDKQIFRSQIAGLDSDIRGWIETHYGKHLQVSVQLASDVQGIFRPDPCNKVCYNYVRNQNMQSVCDASDFIMKANIIEEVVGHNRRATLMYRCHGGISNIAIPFGNVENRSVWYIFLGQFVGVKCKAKDQCEDFCKAERIRLVRKNEILESQSFYVQAGELCLTRSFNQKMPIESYRELPDLHEFTIPELAVCKVIAIEKLIKFLTDKPLPKSVTDWIAIHGGSRFDPSDRQIIEGIEKTLRLIKRFFPNFGDEVKSVLKTGFLNSETNGGLGARRPELICLSRGIDPAELRDGHVKWAKSYVECIANFGNPIYLGNLKVCNMVQHIGRELYDIVKHPLMDEDVKKEARELLEQIEGDQRVSIEATLRELLKGNYDPIEQVLDLWVDPSRNEKEMHKIAAEFVKLTRNLFARGTA